MLPDPGWLPFVLVLVPEVVLQTYHSSIFGALASPRALEQLLRLGCLSGFSSGGCPRLLGLKAVQRVMAVCDRWVCFSCIGGPSLGLLCLVFPLRRDPKQRNETTETKPPKRAKRAKRNHRNHRNERNETAETTETSETKRLKQIIVSVVSVVSLVSFRSFRWFRFVVSGFSTCLRGVVIFKTRGIRKRIDSVSLFILLLQKFIYCN